MTEKKKDRKVNYRFLDMELNDLRDQHNEQRNKVIWRWGDLQKELNSQLSEGVISKEEYAKETESVIRGRRVQLAARLRQYERNYRALMLGAVQGILTELQIQQGEFQGDAE